MSTLTNFPMVSQLTTITGDGRPSENAQYDCVAASIDACCRWLLGQPENSVFNPDNFKDKGPGQGYVGGTDAKDYVEFCKSLGVNLYAVQGNPGHLVDLTHQYLADGKPVIFTEPDPYVSNTLGWSHVCVFYQDGPGYITAMDPYVARPVHRTDQEWIQLLLGNEIWIAERLEDNMKIDINSPNVANYFTEQSPGWWLCKQTGKIVHGEILGFYCAIGGLLDLGLPVSNEIPLDTKGNTKQHFERGVVFFDPGHQYDNPPGAGRVYKAHLYSGLGQDPQIEVLETQLKQLESKLMEPAGIDPVKVANFQQAAALQIHDLVTKAQTIESSLVVPLA